MKVLDANFLIDYLKGDEAVKEFYEANGDESEQWVVPVPAYAEVLVGEGNLQLGMSKVLAQISRGPKSTQLTNTRPFSLERSLTRSGQRDRSLTVSTRLWQRSAENWMHQSSQQMATSPTTKRRKSSIPRITATEASISCMCFCNWIFTTSSCNCSRSTDPSSVTVLSPARREPREGRLCAFESFK